WGREGGASSRPTVVSVGAGGKHSVEGGLGRSEDVGPHELHSLGGTSEAVHAGVLPLHRYRSLIIDRIEHSETRLPRHITAPGGDKIPTPTRVSPRQMGTQTAIAPVTNPCTSILAVHVVDTIPEVVQEPDRV